MFKETLEEYLGKYSLSNFGEVNTIEIRTKGAEIESKDKYSIPININRITDGNGKKLKVILELLKYLNNGGLAPHIRNYFGKININLEKSKEDQTKGLLILETEKDKEARLYNTLGISDMVLRLYERNL